MDKQQLKHRIFNSIVMKESYVKINGGEFPAGRVIFDKDRGMVINTVSDKFVFVSTKSLYDELLSRNGSINIKAIAESKDRKTHYVRCVTNQKISVQSLDIPAYLGYTIGNSYNNRFLPFVNVNLYSPVTKGWIETDIPYFLVKRKSGIELYEEAFTVLISLLTLYEKTEVKYPYGDLPNKFKDYGMELADNKISDSKINVLKWASEIAKQWAKTTFELSRNFQLNIWRM